MNSTSSYHHFTSSRQWSVDPTVISNRNELILGTYAAIDTEYRVNQSHDSKIKPHTISSVAIVDSLGNIKVKHESDFQYYQFPEKALVLLRFAEIKLSNNKRDPNHNPSFKSNLLRIPYTLNSKCLANGTDPEVEVIRKFDPINVPKLGLQLLREFRLYLADQDINKAKIGKKQHVDISSCTDRTNPNYVPQCYQWIGNNLLEKPIPDHRKYTIDLILAPYLTNIKHLSYNETRSMIDGWILGCNSVNRLQPSLAYFEDKIKNAVGNSIQKGIFPIKKETMAAKYPEWFSDLRKWHVFDYVSDLNHFTGKRDHK